MSSGRWHVVPDQEIDVDTVMRNCIEFSSRQDILEGALVYRIQRKHAEYDRPAQDRSKCIQLLVAWHVEHTKELHMRALLIEHDGELDEDKLRQVYQKYWHSLDTLVNSTEMNWLLDDATMLETKIKAMNGDYRWDIFISEGSKYYAKRPLWLDTTRWVAIVLEIFLMLTCTVSLTLHRVIAIAVHNEYPDIELVSPVYFCVDGTYYEYPVERTDKGVMMKFDFRFNPDQDKSGGILMYEIRRKNNEISDRQSSTDTMYAKVIEEASKMMRFLVIWKIKHVAEHKESIMLVEHDSELVLNEDKLAQLYENINEIPYDYYRYTWSMCNNMVLAIKCEESWRTSFELEITIFKKLRYQVATRPMRDDSERKPMWIDSGRQVSSLII
jgi:hypothetical protein